MIASLTFIVALQTSPGQVFDRCVDAVARNKAMSVSIAVDGSANGLPSHERTQLSFIRPRQLKLHIELAQSGNQAASKRSYFLNGARFTAYDELNNQALSRSATNVGTLLTRLSELVGDVGVAVNMLVDPAATRAFLDGFEKLPGWTVQQSGALIEAKRTSTVAGKTTTTAFTFDRQTMLPKSVRLISATSNVYWTYTYKPAPKSISLSVPPGARRVTSFTERSAPPVYADKSARATVEASRRAYERLKAAAVTVSIGQHVSRYWIAGSRIRELQPRMDWSYGSGILTIRDLRSGRTYRGRIKRGAIVDVLERLHFSMEPRLRQYVLGRNPMDVLFGSHQRVRSSGSLVANGAALKVVEATGGNLVVSASIREDNHLLASINVTNMDSSGGVLGRSMAEFRYQNVNAAGSLQSNLVTPVPKGAKVLPLPRAPKSK